MELDKRIVAADSGPWVVAADGSAATLIRQGDQRTGKRIASTFVQNQRDLNKGESVTDFWARSLAAIRRNEANARLIAAAPDLLNALRSVVKVADRATVEFDAARAAIAKATGE